MNPTSQREYMMRIEALEEQLADSKAYAAQFREALETCKKEMQGDKWDNLYIDGILSTPTDNTALRQSQAKLLREIADNCHYDRDADMLRRKADELMGQ